ncbi:hypothetical protein [Novosphingobium sp. 9U]|uniref:hypothetical protein n=1 Tax=Novosphingobium sp. 9U TaxID=2653158 RepID=UPI0012EEEC7C|nr:hypothetical protein [Novosphingobium sp. 9U]VWX46872.1 conserved membrane hypothetical protein [Novosphingobium sp. 9U]
MKLWLAIAILGAIYAVIHVLLIPAIERNWLAMSNGKKYAKAGTIAALETLRDFLKIALIVFVAAFVILSVVTLVSPAFGGTLLQWTYHAVSTLNDVISPMRDFLGGLVLWIALAALFWAAWRMRKGGITAALEAERHRQIDALFADDAQFEDLPPSSDMDVVAGNIATVDALMAQLQDAGGPEASAKLKQLETMRDQLVTQYTYMDVDRRIDLSSVPIDEAEPGPGIWARLRLGLFSKGMQSTLGGTGKLLKRVGTSAACLLVVGVSAPVLAASGIIPTLGSINDLQVYRTQALAQESLKQIARVAASKPPAPQQDEQEEPDAAPGAVSPYRVAAQQFAHSLAGSSDFRSSLAHAQPDLGNAPAALRDADRVVEEVAIRDALLREFSANSSERAVALRGVGFGDFDAMPPEARQRYGAFREHVAREASAPRQDAVVDRLEQWLRAKADASPRFKKRLLAGVALFQQPATLGDMFSTVVDEVLSDSIKAALPDPGAPGLFADKAFGAGEDGLNTASSRMVQSKLTDFLNDIEAGKPYAKAIEGVRSGRRVPAYFLRSEAPAVHARLAQADDSVTRIAATANDLHPSLQAADNPKAAVRVEQAVVRLQSAASGSAPALRQALEGSAGSYEDLFPGRAQAMNESPLGKALSKVFSYSVEMPATVSNAVSGLADIADFANFGGSGAKRASAGASRSFARLMGSVRVGGVLIGSTPTKGAPLQVQDIVWQSQGRDVAISLLQNGRIVPIGKFDGEMVQQALAYAADERPTTVTMTSGPLMLGMLRVHIHPALLDSELGCEMMELDRFVDTATSDWEPREEWSTMAETQLAVYNGAAGDRDRLDNLDVPFETAVNQAFPSSWNAADPKMSLFAHDPERFDGALVKRMGECRSQLGQGHKAYMTCVGSPVDPLRYPSQPYAVWSGVREASYPLSLDSLRYGPSANRLRFMLQVAFERQPPCDDEACENMAPGTPWEFPAIASGLSERTLSFAHGNASAARILARADRFTALQRLFRVALSGGLGDGFPRHRLIALMQDAAKADPIDPVTTPDWNQSRERALQLLALLRKEPSDNEIAAARLEYIESVAQPDSGERFSGGDTCKGGAYALH